MQEVIGATQLGSTKSLSVFVWVGDSITINRYDERAEFGRGHTQIGSPEFMQDSRIHGNDFASWGRDGSFAEKPLGRLVLSQSFMHESRQE